MSTLKKKFKIFVVYGGYSAEAEVSIRSGQNILENLDERLFSPYPILLSKEGFFSIEGERRTFIDLNNFGIASEEGFVTPDYVFIALHGSPGEDGIIQSILEYLHIPYFSVSSDISSLTFNKYLCNRVASAAGIRVPKAILLSERERWSLSSIKDEFNTPLFIKPNKNGSSIGVQKVLSFKDFEKLLNDSITTYGEIVLEEAVSGKELTTAVFSFRGQTLVSPSSQALLEEHNLDYWNYASKTNSQQHIGLTPAPLSIRETEVVESFMRKLYRIFGSQGVLRVDFIIDEKSKEPCLLEINTIPGMSKQSVFPRQIEAMGLTMKAFVTQVIIDKICSDYEI